MAYPDDMSNMYQYDVTGTVELDEGIGHAAMHDKMHAAIDALETELGIIPRGNFADLAARLFDIEDRLDAIEERMALVEDAQNAAVAAPPAAAPPSVTLSDADPHVFGLIARPGVANEASRADHVHKREIPPAGNANIGKTLKVGPSGEPEWVTV